VGVKDDGGQIGGGVVERHVEARDLEDARRLAVDDPIKVLVRERAGELAPDVQQNAVAFRQIGSLTAHVRRSGSRLWSHNKTWLAQALSLAEVGRRSTAHALSRG